VLPTLSRSRLSAATTAPKTTSGDPLRTFNSLESADLPHQGKISFEEARLVRENLEAVSENHGAAQGLPPVDPSNPIDAKGTI
jgi:hypothetical protein